MVMDMILMDLVLCWHMHFIQVPAGAVMHISMKRRNGLCRPEKEKVRIHTFSPLYDRII